MDLDEENVIAEDMPKLLTAFQELSVSCDNVVPSLDRTVLQVQDGALDTSNGLSFLDVKNHLLLSYLTNLTYVMLRKATGQQIEGDEAIERIVEIRTVLEKMRPIEQKLKYQMDKLVKTATTGITNKDDPLQFTAKPDNLVSKLRDDDDKSDDESDEDGGKSKKHGVKLYVPPKVAAVHYDGDRAELSKQEKEKRVRRMALSSSTMQELHEEYFEGPKEIMEDHDFRQLKTKKDVRDRIRYEEEHFTRLTLPKKQKMQERQFPTTLRDVTEFGNINALLNDEDPGASFQGAHPKNHKKSKNSKKHKGHKRRKF